MTADPGPKGTYHHGDLRQALIDSACCQLQTASADALSLRALARELGVSQTAPYRHFESRNALFAAIATQGFDLLTVELRAAVDRHPDNVEEAFIAVGQAYVEWAINHPEKYQLFFDSSILDFNDYPVLQEAGSNCFAVLLGLIAEGQEQGLFLKMPVEHLAGVIWASVHGLASLLQKQRGRKSDSREVPATKSLQALEQDPRSALELFLNSIRVPC